MSSLTITIAFIAGIAALMAAGFLFAWLRDKQNADEVEADPERLDTAADTDVALESDRAPGQPVPSRQTPL